MFTCESSYVCAKGYIKKITKIKRKVNATTGESIQAREITHVCVYLVCQITRTSRASTWRRGGKSQHVAVIGWVTHSPTSEVTCALQDHADRSVPPSDTWRTGGLARGLRELTFDTRTWGWEGIGCRTLSNCSAHAQKLCWRVLTHHDTRASKFLQITTEKPKLNGSGCCYLEDSGKAPRKGRGQRVRVSLEGKTF